MALTPVNLQFTFFGLLWLIIGIGALRMLTGSTTATGETAGAPGVGRMSVAAPASAGPVEELLVEMPEIEGVPAHRERLVIGSSEVTIGRSKSSRLQIFDEFASSQHAVLRRTPDSLVLEDLGSKNGTFLNGAPVTRPTPLNHGDVITIGKTVIHVP